MTYLVHESTKSSQAKHGWLLQPMTIDFKPGDYANNFAFDSNHFSNDSQSSKGDKIIEFIEMCHLLLPDHFT
jgi:hypothetical protein